MKLRRLIDSLLPGIFLFGFSIGTGSVTAMAKAGTDYGMTLLWALLLSCVITYFLIDRYGLFAIVSGETALSAFRRHIHPAVGIFFIVTLTAHVSGSVMGVMGILSEACHEWSRTVVEGGIPPLAFAIFFISLVYLLFLTGKTKSFEVILAVVVAVMTLCFLVTFLLMMPPAGEIARGFLPRVPPARGADSPFLVIASLVGTTVFSGLFILRTTLVREAGWTLADLRTQRRDAMVSGGMMFVASAAIMGAAAGTLHPRGVRLESVSQMIGIMEPVAGLFAVSIFTLGIVGAGVSSQFPNVTLLPWLLDDYRGSRPDLRRWDYRLMVAAISLLGLVVPVFNARPVAVMITSQAFGALILPATVGCILYLGNRRDLMREHAFRAGTNVALVLILLFALTMSWMSYSGLFQSIRAS